MEKLKYQFEISNYWNVIKIANVLLAKSEHWRDYAILMYKAASYANLLEDKKAISTYEEIIAYHPSKVLPKIRVALIYIEIGEFELANRHLSNARAIEPDNLEVINNQIFIAEQLHKFQKVIELSSKAIALDEYDPSVWLVRASARERLHQYKQSIEDGLKAISLSRDDDIYLHMAYNNLGHTYSKKGDLTKAEYYLRKAIELDKTEPFQYNNLGLVLAQSGKLHEGLNYINHSLQLDSQNSYAYKNRAKVYLLQGDQKNAKRDLMHAKSLDYDIEYDNEVNELLETL